jgi:hypothetical protein
MANPTQQPQAFQLPTSTIAWLRDEERRTGVKISRLCLAALCAYASGDRTARQIRIEQAMNIIAGESSIEDLCETASTTAPARPAKVPR